jgi:hypothetical protein
MLNEWQVCLVCGPWKNLNIFSFQELCADLCDMGRALSCNCVHITALPLCLQRWHQQTTRQHYAIHAVGHLPGTVETGINPWGTHISSLPVAIEGEHLPTEVSQDADCCQVKKLVRVTSTQMSFTEMISDSFCRYSSVVQTHSFISCLNDWSQSIPQVKKLDVEILGWRGYTWSAVVRPVRRTAKFSNTTLMASYGRETNITFSGNSSGGHSCSQHVNCTLPHHLRNLWHCIVCQNCTF